MVSGSQVRQGSFELALAWIILIAGRRWPGFLVKGSLMLGWCLVRMVLGYQKQYLEHLEPLAPSEPFEPGEPFEPFNPLLS